MKEYTSVEGQCITLTDEHAPKFEVIAYKIVQYVDEKEETKKEILVNAAVREHSLSTVNKVSTLFIFVSPFSAQSRVLARLWKNMWKREKMFSPTVSLFHYVLFFTIKDKFHYLTYS